ncbi:MAG: cell division protein FtsW [Clostridia bacterium]|nr:cell division protein FtsW [Clostridia bacterium]
MIKKISIKSKDGAKCDAVFMLLVSLLAIYGTVMVISSGMEYADVRYDDRLYFAKRHIVWLALGFVTMLLASRVEVEKYKKYTPTLYAVTLLLLIIVLFFGFVGNGAKRWISIGPITIQPSEFSKLSLVMMLALYFSKNEKRILDYKSKGGIFKYGTLYPCLIMLSIIIPVMLQKHLSCIIILGLIGLSTIFLSGANTKYIRYFCIAAVIAVTCLALFTDYTKERIMVWRDPEGYKLTGGWQTLQGLMAIGSGGIFGVGLGNSVLKHCYVSEPANDMVFTILCEELGFVGALVAVVLFVMLILRGYYVSLKHKDTYARLLGLGISTKMAIQVLLNIAVVTNTIPNTGISLPFFSYGGSSLIMLFFEMGIMLQLSRKVNI